VTSNVERPANIPSSPGTEAKNNDRLANKRPSRKLAIEICPVSITANERRQCDVSIVSRQVKQEVRRNSDPNCGAESRTSQRDADYPRNDRGTGHRGDGMRIGHEFEMDVPNVTNH